MWRAKMDAAFEKIMAAGWLGTIAPGLRQGFQNALKLKEFASGSEVYAFEQDQPCLWGVASGGVHLFVAMNEQLPTLAHIAGPGAWFGDAHVVLGGGRAVRVTSFGPSSLYRIERGEIAKLASQNPDAWLEVAKLTAMNALTAIGAGEDLMIRDSRKRLIAVLLRLSGHRNNYQGTLPLKSVPLTHEELADACRLSRSSAAAILRDLVSRKVIQTEYRSIRIVDAKALEAGISE